MFCVVCLWAKFASIISRLLLTRMHPSLGMQPCLPPCFLNPGVTVSSSGGTGSSGLAGGSGKAGRSGTGSDTHTPSTPGSGYLVAGPGGHPPTRTAAAGHSSRQAADSDDDDEDEGLHEAWQDQLHMQRFVQALRMPGMCADLGLQAPPASIQPLTQEAYAKAFRPMWVPSCMASCRACMPPAHQPARPPLLAAHHNLCIVCIPVCRIPDGSGGWLRE